jgi:hypothetical protein
MTVPCLVLPVRPDLRGIRSLRVSEPLGFGNLCHTADVERWLFVLEPLDNNKRLKDTHTYVLFMYTREHGNAQM